MGDGLNVFSIDDTVSSDTYGQVTGLSLGIAAVEVSYIEVEGATPLKDDISVRVGPAP